MGTRNACDVPLPTGSSRNSTAGSKPGIIGFLLPRFDGHALEIRDRPFPLHVAVGLASFCRNALLCTGELAKCAVKPASDVHGMRVGLIEQFSIDVQSTIEPLRNKDLASCLPEPGLFRDLISHEGGVEQRAAGTVLSNQRALMLRWGNLRRPKQIGLELQRARAHLGWNTRKLLTTFTYKHQGRFQGVFDVVGRFTRIGGGEPAAARRRGRRMCPDRSPGPSSLGRSGVLWNSFATSTALPPESFESSKLRIRPSDGRSKGCPDTYGNGTERASCQVICR